MEVFKKRPKVILGLTKTHFIIHTIKVFKKHHLTSLIIPLIALAVLENLMPIYLLWALFTGASGYGLYLMRRKIKTIQKRKEKHHAKSNHINR